MKQLVISGLKVLFQAALSKKYAQSLLFIHGMYGGAWVFEKWLELAASAGYDAYALDLRGHHESRPVENLGRVSIQDYVQDVLDVLDYIGESVLIGHSMGGLIAQIVASQRSDIKASVLISSAPPRGISALSWGTAVRMSRWYYLKPALFKQPLVERTKDSLALVLNKMSDPYALLEKSVPESGLVSREISLPGIPIKSADINCPMFVVGGRQDELIPPRVQGAIAQKYEADHLELSGHGHLPMFEPGSEKVFDQIIAWIASHS